MIQEWLQLLLEEYASMAPLIIFFGFIAAAFYVPISEDLTTIAAGILVASIAPEIKHQVHIALFSGAVIGDLLAYSLGYKFGEPLFKIKFFKHKVTEERLNQLRKHFYNHAALTIILGRLIPFGVRNAISLLAGIVHLKPWKFLILDSIPAAFSISLIYYLSQYYSQYVLQNVRFVQIIFLIVFLTFITYIITSYRQRKSRQ